jgi:hypothetical protein
LISPRGLEESGSASVGVNGAEGRAVFVREAVLELLRELTSELPHAFLVTLLAHDITRCDIEELGHKKLS